MRKNNTSHKVRRPTAKRARSAEPLTLGLDLGDKTSRYAILDEHGEVLMERTVATTQKALGGLFGSLGPTRVAMEVGTHSPWVSRLAAGGGHEVIVANSRNLRLISESSRKDDRMDARTLARLARADPQLLSPIRHRSVQAQAHLMVIRARAAVVDARTALINAARGLVKAAGERLPASGADAVNENLAKELSPALQPAIVGLLRQAAQLTREIQVLAQAAGARRALHSGAAWSGLRPQALGREAGRARRQECPQMRGGGGGEEAGRAVASAVGERGTLSTLAPGGDSGGSSSLGLGSLKYS